MVTADPPSSAVELSLTEWVVLALVCETPSHGFGLAKELRPNTDLGRIVSVSRPLVYRALDRLVDQDLAEAHRTEPGDSGPIRTICRPTKRGRVALDTWLDRPVGHIRDLRIEFLIKIRLNHRRSRSVSSLVRAQQIELAGTFSRLTGDQSNDVVDLWRRHNAEAARSFLTDLAGTEPK